MIEILIQICILLILFYSSYYDLKYHAVPLYIPVLLYLLATVYILTSGVNPLVSNVNFLLIMGFGVVAFIFGGLGIGDVFLLSALGFTIPTLTEMQTFLLILATCMILTAVLHIFKSIKDKNIIVDIKGVRRIVDVDKLEEGMVLMGKRAVTGLSKKDIEEIKKDGVKQVMIKECAPLVPAITIAYIIYIVSNILI